MNRQIKSSTIYDGVSLRDPEYKNNKTAGYQQHIFRPQPSLLKMPFKTMNFFSNFFFIKFSNFSKFKFIWFLQKNPQFRCVNTFLWSNIIWYAFYSKFATFGDFEKYQAFSKKIYFFKRNLIFERFERYYYFGCILRQICYNLVKKIQSDSVRFEKSDIITWPRAWKYVGFHPFEWIINSAYFKNGEKIIAAVNFVMKHFI